ncbi:MAG: hypothetical protein M3Y58_18190 [Chloroflexota bacterium]|nr:hypothetical protein [Chloroflexota bacterium]
MPACKQPQCSRSHWGTVGVLWLAVLAAFLLFAVGSGALHLIPVVAGILAFGLVAVAFIVVVRTQGSDAIKPGP